VPTGKLLHRFRCESAFQFAHPGLTFSPDGKRLGYVRGSDSACVWDVGTGKEILRFDGPVQRSYSHCCFTPDSKEFALSGGTRVQFWDLNSGKERRSVPADYVSFLSPDAEVYVRVDERKALRFGDARTGKETGRLEIPAAHNGVEDGVAFSDDGKMLAVVHVDKEVQVRDFPAGKVRFSAPLPAMARANPPQRRYAEYRVGFGHDGKTLFLAVQGGTIHRWDLAAKKELPPIEAQERTAADFHTLPDRRVLFQTLPDGRTLLATGADGAIRRWDLQTGRELSGPEGYRGRVCAAYAPDGRLAAVGDRRGRLDLWDARSGKLLRTLRSEGPAVLNTAFAPDGKTLAVVRVSHVLQQLDVSSGREVRSLKWEGMPAWFFPRTLLFTPDGRGLCVSDHPTQMRLFDLAAGKVRWRADGEFAGAFSPDGKTLAANFGGSYLTFLDAATGKERSKRRLDGERPGNRVAAIAFSPDGQRLAVALDEGYVSLCDGRSGAEVKRFCTVDQRKRRFPQLRNLHGAEHRVIALSYSPDGHWLATGGSDAAVCVWEASTGEEVLCLNGHEGNVSSVAFGRDGRTVLSCGGDAQAYLWDLRPAPGAARSPEALWEALGGANPADAYRAVWALSETKAVGKFLRERLAPIKPPDAGRVAKWITDLNSPRFRVRDEAAKALANLGELAGPTLEKALAAPPSVEVHQRVRNLLEALKRGPTPLAIRDMRAVQALELAGTAEARETLRAWAGGASGARLTEDARAALRRLDRRDKLDDQETPCP
jgi:WD40 repeat protein